MEREGAGGHPRLRLPSAGPSRSPRRQEAKSWELRATLSLSRLLHKEGRSDKSRCLLSEIYGWFTEGFDTPDLQKARALLEELGE